MTTRAKKIDTIIESRKPLVEKIRTSNSKLKTLNGHFESFARIVKELINRESNEALDELQSLLPMIAEVQGKINNQEGLLSLLCSRLERPTINIGVVGRARQGKSRLLQAVSGLTKSEIPDGDSGHCTGARSRLFHTHGDVKATVFFHNASSLLKEVLEPYYKELKLGTAPSSLQEFATQPLAKLPNTETNVESKNKYDHLKKYHVNFPRYKEFLDSDVPKNISRNQIREYVAQDDLTGQVPYYNYLAVKEVVIYCPFPNQDVGKVCLVDMPGLGDTGHGDEDRLISTLGRETDFVLFVKKPNRDGDDWNDVDVRLYDVANDSLKKGLSIDKWSFQLLNHRREAEGKDNLHNCERLAKTISGKHIKVADCIVCDCSNSKEVQEKVLEKTLNYLVQHIQELDAEYAQNVMIPINEVLVCSKEIVNKSKAIFSSGVNLNSNAHKVFLNKFNGLYEKLANGIRSFVKEKRKTKDQENEEYNSGVGKILEKIKEKPLYPDKEKILALESDRGSLLQAYLDALHFTRAAISREFLSMDSHLDLAVSKFQNSIILHLKENCGFGEIFQGEKLDFFKELCEFLSNDISSPDLALAIKIVSDFRLSYREFLHPRIRKSLDVLDPNSIEYISCGKTPTVDAVMEALEAANDRAISQLRNSLKRFSPEVNMALFALAEEFEDRALRAKEIKDQWSVLCEALKADLWKNDFSQLEENSHLRKSLEKSLKAIENTISELSKPFF